MENTGGAVPTARAGIESRAVGDGAIAYDPSTMQTHALTPMAAAVFARCDGSSTIDEIARALACGDRSATSVSAALSELEAAGLVTLADAGWSRRRMITRIAAAGAAGVAIPLVTSVVAPSIAAAQSAGGGGGGDGGGGDGDGGDGGECVLPARQSSYRFNTSRNYEGELWFHATVAGVPCEGRLPFSGGTVNPIDPESFFIALNFNPRTITWFDCDGVQRGVSNVVTTTGGSVVSFRVGTSSGLATNQFVLGTAAAPSTPASLPLTGAGLTTLSWPAPHPGTVSGTYPNFTVSPAVGTGA